MLVLNKCRSGRLVRYRERALAQLLDRPNGAYAPHFACHRQRQMAGYRRPHIQAAQPPQATRLPKPKPASPN